MSFSFGFSDLFSCYLRTLRPCPQHFPTPVLLNFSEPCLAIERYNVETHFEKVGVSPKIVYTLTDTRASSKLPVYMVRLKMIWHLLMTKQSYLNGGRTPDTLRCQNIPRTTPKTGRHRKTFLSNVLFCCHFLGVSEDSRLREKQKGLRYPKGKICFLL